MSCRYHSYEKFQNIFLVVCKRTIQHKHFHSLGDPAFGSVRFPCFVHATDTLFHVYFSWNLAFAGQCLAETTGLLFRLWTYSSVFNIIRYSFVKYGIADIQRCLFQNIFILKEVDEQELPRDSHFVGHYSILLLGYWPRW